MKHIPPQQLHPSSSPPGGDETTIHKPVLLEDTVRLLSPRAGETYLDLTAGYGGHAKEIMAVAGPESATLVDRDQYAIDALGIYAKAGARVIKSDFAGFAEAAAGAGKQYDMVLVDLGVSSPQLDMAERGFSIQHEGPLDMRMDQSSATTAADLVNHISARELTRIIEHYGEERPKRARTIAAAICKARPIKTTSQLAAVILQTNRSGYQKTHPATRTFQAIRIALNHELEQLERLLLVLPRLLRLGGRVVIISFHSLEDRMVKQYFADNAAAGFEAEFRLLTKKPVRGAASDVHNPRARSASLRAAVKI